MNIVEVIRQETSALPRDKVAVRCEVGDLTYGAMFQGLEKLADRLREQGVGPRDRVGLSFPDGTDYILLSLAILSLDAAMIPVPATGPSDIVEDTLEKTGADVHIRPASESGADFVASDALTNCSGFWLTRRTSAPGWPEAAHSLHPAFIRFSSGTTGRSKGVLLTHEAILERTNLADQALKIRPEDTILWVLSMSYHFVVTILLFLRRGATIWLSGESFPFSFLSSVRRGGGTFIYATPFHYRILTETRALDADSLRGIRMAVSTAMKLPPEVATAFHEKFGFPLTEAYGIIEVGLPFVNEAGSFGPGSVGRALPGYELRIRSPDESGAGEVLLRGPGLYAAYVHPWRLRSPGEWFETGDIGRLDPDDALSLLGRTKDVINFAGMKVFPYEVEAVLESYPGVRASRVYAEPHSQFGQLPCALIEADAGVDIEAVRRFAYSKLISYKVPKKIEKTDRLERTGSGKIRRSPCGDG
ncbi:MAG: fatty acid--CoA ligase family protein [Kiritimatiellia bacterium]|nr:fatty acid--CoA ligase family protein [Kiritimatiellia bacterium]